MYGKMGKVLKGSIVEGMIVIFLFTVFTIYNFYFLFIYNS
jgi:hypothetical protein